HALLEVTHHDFADIQVIELAVGVQAARRVYVDFEHHAADDVDADEVETVGEKFRPDQIDDALLLAAEVARPTGGGAGGGAGWSGLMMAGRPSFFRNRLTASSERVMSVRGRISAGNADRYMRPPARWMPSGSLTTKVPPRRSRQPNSTAGFILGTPAGATPPLS